MSFFRSNSSSDKPKFSSPKSEFSNPKFKDFSKYCYLYDPLVSISSSVGFDYLDCEVYRTQSAWHRRGFNHLRDNCLGDSKLNYYFCCTAPYIERIDSHTAIKLVENYQKEIASLKTTQTSDELIKNLSKKLNRSSLVKQYIHYESEEKKGWMIILRTINNENEYRDPTIGVGVSLQEASIAFAENLASEFFCNFSVINTFLDEQIPLTPQEMFDCCSKFDPEVDPLSSRFIKGYQYTTSTIPDAYSLQCRSSRTAFTMNVREGDVIWRVKKSLDLKNENPELGDKFPIQVSSDVNLQEAFQLCEEKVNYLKTNPEALREAIYHFEQKILAEEMEDVAREGQDFIDSMISEYGEDVFTDR